MNSKLLLPISIAAIIFSPHVFSHDYSQEKEAYLKSHPLRSDVRQSGIKTAEYLNEDYLSTVSTCDTDSTPAFLCSGVLFRGTDVFSTSYHSWDPSPASQTSGGVSFSYLRADSKFTNLAYSYNNGFIFFPYFYAPDGEGIDTNIDVMCSFPIDAATVSRSDEGCGASSGAPANSGPCQAQGITTAAQWHAHYVQGGNNRNYQCGFTTDDDSSYNTADGFYQSILSMATIADESFQTQNELRLATWAQGKQDSLPINAFFYLSGTAGLNNAQQNQKDFYNSTTNAVWIPVIEMILPASENDEARFEYLPADQLIPEPLK